MANETGAPVELDYLPYGRSLQILTPPRDRLIREYLDRAYLTRAESEYRPALSKVQFNSFRASPAWEITVRWNP